MKNIFLRLAELLGRAASLTLSVGLLRVSLRFSNPLHAHTSQAKAVPSPSYPSRLLKKLALVCFFFSSYLLNAQNKPIPPLNQKILNFVKQNMNKTVDRGECWDLAAVPLYQYNAKWDGSFQFGKLLDPEKDIIFPGDIIQFFDVVFEYKKEDVLYKETMQKHTAIVYKVIGKKHYEIAHQNTSEWGKIVKTSTINLNNLKVGKIYFYRPQPQ